MKEILVMRHAKSDWSDSMLQDFNRPLNKRGKKAAPLIGEKIKSLMLVPDIILSSPAVRAKQTATLAAEKCRYFKEIVWVDDFYFGNENDIIQVVKTLSDDISRVLIIGHNPTLESMISKLTSNGSLKIRLPTAGLVYIQTEVESWKDLKYDVCMLQWVVTPKLIKALQKD